MNHIDHHRQIAGSSVGFGAVGLVHHEDIGNLENPGLDGLDVVPQPGDHHHQRGMGGADDFHLVLADADRLDDDDIPPHGIEDADDIVGGAGESAEVSAGPERADENAVVGGVPVHADAIAQDGTAAERAGGIDRHHGHGFALLPKSLDQLVGQGGFAGPGRAGHSQNEGLARMGIELFQFRDGTRHAVVDIPHQPGRGPDITF